MSEPRVTDDDDSRFVFEGFGPAATRPTPERRRLHAFLRRVLADAVEHPADYGALRDPLARLAENYARTCESEAELSRRLDADAAEADARGAAAVLLRKVWRARLAADARDPGGPGAAQPPA